MKSVLLSLFWIPMTWAYPSHYMYGDHQVVLNDHADVMEGSSGFHVDLNAQRLVQMEGQEPVWMTEFEKLEAKRRGIKFFDVTEASNSVSPIPSKLQNIEYPTPTATEMVTKVFNTITTAEPRKNLEKFTSFYSRYYMSDYGRQSSEWLKATIENITAEYASPALQNLISIEEFPHSWLQSSTIVKINGSSLEHDGLVIIGAHQDSINSRNLTAPAPGADDNGSGSVTILEAYRALVALDFRPARNVEFHWYAAEELGLLGSQAIVEEYQARGTNVYAMWQFDSTAWLKDRTREEVGIVVDDYVDASLTNFTMQLVDAYLDIPYAITECGYACSDHASWNKYGYPAAHCVEGDYKNYNHNVHSVNDRIDISHEFSFEHLVEFTKLAAAFAIELGAWTGV